MERREFINKCNQCAAVSLLGIAIGTTELQAQVDKSTDNPLVQTINQKQVTNFLKFIETSLSKEVVEKLSLLTD